MKKKVYQVKEGYNKIAPYYDTWYWQEFWKRNEKPHVEKWCKFLRPGYGADLGTGSGNNIDVFLQSGQTVDAYDISEKMLVLCKKKLNHFIEIKKLQCIECNIEDIFVHERKYDWLLSNRVLSHIKNIEHFIERISQIIKYEGICFISDVHPLRHYTNTHYVISDEDVLIETYKHPVDDIKRTFEEKGFEILKYKEMFSEDVVKTEKISFDDAPIFYYLIIKYHGFNRR